MRNQEDIKKRYIKFLDESGCKQKFLCLKLGINESTISRWKNDKLYLPNYDLISIENYLVSKGF